MKFSTNTDFTKFPRAISVVSGSDAGAIIPFDIAVLAHDERHLRRRVVELVHGDKVLVDLLEPVMLNDRDRLVLEDGASRSSLPRRMSMTFVPMTPCTWPNWHGMSATAISPLR